jgi:PadR family transcriptional regulator PadR
MGRSNLDVLRGTLDLLILKAVSWRPVHGYDIARWIERAADDVLAVEEGTLYPALHRLEDRGWIRADWGLSENNRRAKFYALTATGRAQLRLELKSWARFANAVFAALEAPPLPSTPS